MKLVLDASAFLSGRLNSIPEDFEKVITVTSVKKEVNRGNPGRLISNLMATGLEILDPSSRNAAIEAANKTGDMGELSPADLDIISISVELGDVVVMTDDFRIQNVLESLGISFIPAGEIGDRAIEKRWSWSYRCRGCGRYYEKKFENCPICGSDLKKTRKK